jgi:hypothetical protein
LADLSISLSESINVFGLAPSTKWNEFSWGSGKWGEGTNGIFKQVGKYITDSEAATDSVSKSTGKYIADSETVTMVETNTELRDGSGYSYVFPGGASDAEEQVITDFTRQSNGSTAWTKQSNGSTSWS